jgi:hypothetical protein
MPQDPSLPGSLRSAGRTWFVAQGRTRQGRLRVAGLRVHLPTEVTTAATVSKWPEARAAAPARSYVRHPTADLDLAVGQTWAYRARQVDDVVEVEVVKLP